MILFIEIVIIQLTYDDIHAYPLHLDIIYLYQKHVQFGLNQCKEKIKTSQLI